MQALYEYVLHDTPPNTTPKIIPLRTPPPPACKGSASRWCGWMREANAQPLVALQLARSSSSGCRVVCLQVLDAHCRKETFGRHLNLKTHAKLRRSCAWSTGLCVHRTP
eukprot:853365-Prymnesium_polylepis.2